MGTRQKVLALFEADPTMKMAAVAKEVGVSRQRVQQICRAVGLPTRNRKIGAEKLTEYRCWWMMLDRCLNPKNEAFKNYGGRGITVCLRWRDFHKFFADMGPKPSPQHSLDRRDNDGHYEPSNCRWATRAEQQRNRRPIKISREDATVIRERYALGQSKRSLAKAFNVTATHIARIVRGESCL
jgi:plasmid maintenance system antidote protein VapI